MSGLNSGNGGNPGIQTWTNRYQATLRVLYTMLQDPFQAYTLKSGVKKDIYYDELIKLGIFKEVGPQEVFLDLPQLRKHSIVVNDELYANMTDLNWLREQRKKLGLIKGRVKDEEFRRKQQARRKARREYARKQAAKYQQMPKEELSLAEVVFDEGSLDSEPSESK